MLKNIYNAIKSLVNFFDSVIDFVIDFFQDLVYVIDLLAETVTSIPDYLGFFPTILVTAIISLVSIAVIFKILGREG